MIVPYVPTGSSAHVPADAIDPAKIEREIGWQPAETFASGIRKTVEWYLANDAWVKGEPTPLLPGAARHTLTLTPP